MNERITNRGLIKELDRIANGKMEIEVGQTIKYLGFYRDVKVESFSKSPKQIELEIFLSNPERTYLIYGNDGRYTEVIL